MSYKDKGLDGKAIADKLGSVRDVLDLAPADASRLYAKHYNPILGLLIRFMGLDREFVDARGFELYDRQGERYLDFLSGFGALNLGHEPQEVIDALRAVERRPNIFQSNLNPFAAKLAEYLAEITPGNLTRSFFCSSGAETVEAALKLARKSTGRRVLLSTDGAYHGKTFGALSVSGRVKYQTPFLPMLPDTERIPFNNAAELEKRVSRGDVAAFIVEPIQGENGVITASPGYLKQAEEICRRYGTLLILDEIQTGMGRTGRLFACNHEGVVPDILLLSKSLGGGVMPIGAMITTDRIWKTAYGSLETGLLHSTTFGGNTRACACAIASIRMLLQGNVIENADTMGQVLIDGLEKIKQKSPLLKDVRGRGLMIGLTLSRLKGKASLAEGALTLWVVRQLLKKYRIITAFTLNNYDVLRIAPPLTIDRKSVDYFLNAFEEVLKSAETFKTFGLVKETMGKAA